MAIDPSELPEPARKELFSIAYVAAIAASAQCELLIPKVDYTSVDVQILATFGKQPQIAVQLKATAQDCIEDGYVVFDLPLKNYNDLRKDRTVPAMLVIVHLPKDQTLWVTHDVNLLNLRNDAYFLNLHGMPDSQNSSTVRIRIPLDQRLTRSSLLDLLQHVSDRHRLPPLQELL